MCSSKTQSWYVNSLEVLVKYTPSWVCYKRPKWLNILVISISILALLYAEISGLVTSVHSYEEEWITFTQLVVSCGIALGPIASMFARLTFFTFHFEYIWVSLYYILLFDILATSRNPKKTM